jgi:hypothetical protein
MGVVWKPAWVREGRRPKWMSDRPFSEARPSEHLWGNMPAFSLLPESEATRRILDRGEEVRLCFAASGDLRNVVDTIAGLPAGYKGKVRVLVNDFSPKIACRNFLLLQVLGQLGLQGVDLAIALWYSLALTGEQHMALSLLISKLEVVGVVKGTREASWAFRQSDSGASITAHFEKRVWTALLEMMTSQWTLQSATNDRNARLLDPERRDFAGRVLQTLQPWHRIAVSEFRSFGLVLPYGALNAHHHTPNRFLLDPISGYTLSDHADPREGWDAGEVLAAGTRNKVPKNDLYGSLFFLLKERVSAVVDRLHSAEVSFELFCEDARSLAKRLQGARGQEEQGKAGESAGEKGSGPLKEEDGTGQSESLTRKGNKKKEKKRTVEGKALRATEAASVWRLLHRVDVSNICDENYVGVTRVLEDWGQLIQPGGVLVGLFMNWANEEMSQWKKMKGDETYGMTFDEHRRALEAVMRLAGKDPEVAQLVAAQLHQMNLSSATPFAHDYSKSFEDYLQHHGADETASKQRMLRSRVHQIVAPRIGVPTMASKGQLPVDFLKTVTEWYWGVFAGGFTGTEIYVEWVKNNDLMMNVDG